MESTHFKPRVQGAVDSERMQLLSILARHWQELDHHDSGGGTLKQKWDLWDQISGEFNALSNVSVNRTPLQVKTLFKNMKTKAKKYKLRLESSKACGVIVESDPVSEIVLQLTNTESEETLQTLLDSLECISTFDISSNMKTEDNELTFSSNSPDNSMAVDYDCDPDIKEEVIEAFDSPCIIQEDDSPITFPAAAVDNFENEEPAFDGRSSPTNDNVESSPEREASPVNDSGVLPFPSEKREGAIKLVSPLTLKANTNNHPSHSAANLKVQEHLNFAVPKLQQKSLINMPLSLGFMQLTNLINNSSGNVSPSVDAANNQSRSKPHLYQRSNDRKACISSYYHEQMTDMARKEHELHLTLLSEGLSAEQAQRKLHEEQLKFKQQNFMLKQEQRRAYMAEHEAKMKLIELEYKVLQNRVANNESSKIFLHNGSKEI